MVRTIAPPRLCGLVPATVIARALAAAVLVGVLLGNLPAHAQTTGRSLSSLPRSQWEPARPGSSQPQYAEYNGSEGTLVASRFGALPSASPRVARRSGPFSCAPADASQDEFRTIWEDDLQVPAQDSVDPECMAESPGFAPYDEALADECGLVDCNPGWGGPCNPCCPLSQGRLWVRGEYLLWWTQGSSLPPLVTTSSGGTPPEEAGILGRPGTSVLFGGQTVNTRADSGGRIAFGSWFDSGHSTGIEASYFGIGRETTHFSAASPATPIIARPYFDTLAGAQSAMLIAHSDFLEGSVNVDVTTQLQAVDVLLRRNLLCDCSQRMDFLVGWRFARLDESLRIDQFSEWTHAHGQVVVGTTKSLFDQFDTRNQFNGAELGVVYQERFRRWFLETLVKLGLGNMRSRVFIDGMTRTSVPGLEPATFTGGLLAQRTNMGRYGQDQFAVIPELGVTLGYDLTRRLKATFGYTFLYWSRVARPGNLVDTNVSQLPPDDPTGARRPAFTFSTSDFWAQGLNFGLDYRF